VGNTLIRLINQASFLLGRQLQALEQTFPKEGGVIPLAARNLSLSFKEAPRSG